MKKIKIYFFITLLINQICFSFVSANNLSNIFTKGEFEGELRSVLYARSADGSPFFTKANGLALGGHAGFTTHPIFNLSGQLAVYTTQPLYGDGISLAATNLTHKDEGYFLLGKANLRYEDGINKAKLGRQEIMTPLVASDDARVIEDLFNVANFSTTFLDKHTFHAMYFDSMSGMDNGITVLGTANDKNDWVNMSQVLGTSYERGMYVLGVENTSFDHLKAEIWYYDIPDTVKEVYLGVKYNHQINQRLLLTYEAHYWNAKSRSSYEDELLKNIDYDFSGLRISAEIDKFTLQFAYEHMSKKAGSHTIHTYFGNYAEYTYGFLMGSGAYGAISTGNKDDDMTTMDAFKLTAKYDLNNDITFFIGYDINTSNQSSLQSDVNILDIALFMDIGAVKNLSLAIIYENWDSNGDNFFIDNNLIRATLKYKF
jgi:hypothetical protein